MRKRLRLKLLYLATIVIFLVAIVLGNEAVTVISQNLPIERAHCFIIDAGHGGEDGGAVSCTGKYESAINLEIALRLNALMEFLGYDTRMIRTTDISVYTKGETLSQKKISDLKQRVQICAETDGAVLLSIHQNTFSDSRYSGAQVFFGGIGESEALAKAVQGAFTASVNPGSNRQAKKAEGVYLMEHISCTGILIECGFLSNPREEAKLSDAEYQKQLCCVIAATVVSFYG